MTQTADILFEEKKGQGGDIGLITLNRPQALNALNQAMFLALDQHIAAWSAAKHIKGIVIRAVPGRAFCAGGDIRAIYEKGIAKDPTLPIFFRDEYRLNRRIFHCPKPYIAILDGITMGGGAGISVHGSHRVATENLIFAMPETGIGFFPDVGGSYFLSRMPAKIGFYLGLSGARIDYRDALALGIATHHIAATSQSDLLEALIDTAFHEKAAVSEIIQKFIKPTELAGLLQQQNIIQTCFAKNSVEEILQALHHQTDEWSHKAMDIIQSRSPTSLKVTLQALQMGAQMNFDACMQMEFRLTNRFIVGHDFFEGVRAVVIDKDQSPQWVPKTLEGVTATEVLDYFAPLKEEFA